VGVIIVVGKYCQRSDRLESAVPLTKQKDDEGQDRDEELLPLVGYNYDPPEQQWEVIIAMSYRPPPVSPFLAVLRPVVLRVKSRF